MQVKKLYELSTDEPPGSKRELNFWVMTEEEKKKLEEENKHLSDEITKFIVGLPDDVIMLLMKVAKIKHQPAQQAFMRAMNAEHKRRGLSAP